MTLKSSISYVNTLICLCLFLNNVKFRILNPKKTNFFLFFQTPNIFTMTEFWQELYSSKRVTSTTAVPPGAWSYDLTPPARETDPVDPAVIAGWTAVCLLGLRYVEYLKSI